MQKSDHKEKRQTILWLLLIYAGSVIIRYLLALATRNYPTVSIDEFLYYSLGRSIATEGSLLYHGQPAVYNYIIYPLILAPVYLLFGHGTDYFRVIELWNIILMSLSVFPFYALCKEMVQKRKTALWLTGLFMLLPQFILSEFIYSESIIYPLFYTLMYCVCRNLKERKTVYSIWIGILGVLLYYSKPGAVLPAVLAFAFFAARAIREKSGKSGIQILAGLSSFAVCFIIIKIIVEQVFGYQGALLSVYDNQVIESKTYNIEYFFSNVIKYPYYFMLAGGILPLLYSLWNYPKYEKRDKQYYVLLIACSLLTMIGVAWVINRPERKNILYLRYVEMYLPILYIFCIVSKTNDQETLKHSNTVPRLLCCLSLAYVVVCTVVWGCTTGIGTIIETHFLISLSALFTENVMGIANIIVILISAVTLYLIVKEPEDQTMAKCCCTLLIVLAVINGIQGYRSTARNTDSKWSNEAAEIHQRLGEKEYIHVYAADQSDLGLDINSRYNTFRITESDFFDNINLNKGVYSPFIPSSVRGMTAKNKTPDVDTLVVDEKIYSRIKFSDETSEFISAENDFKIVRFAKGERIVDSIIVRDNHPTLEEGAVYKIIVYNEKWLTHPVSISLEIESPEEQEIEITTDYTQTAVLNEGRYLYEINVDQPVSEYIFTVKNDTIKFYDYGITPVE